MYIKDVLEKPSLTFEYYLDNITSRQGVRSRSSTVVINQKIHSFGILQPRSAILNDIYNKMSIFAI